MIKIGETVCPNCGNSLKYYDKTKRIVRTKGRKSKYIKIRRVKCNKCRTIHRELPDDIVPYKQYEYEVIYGVIEGLISPEVLGFEDYPCEQTMKKWKREKYNSYNERR